jgi:hypothetical protein
LYNSLLAVQRAGFKIPSKATLAIYLSKEVLSCPLANSKVKPVLEKLSGGARN